MFHSRISIPPEERDFDAVLPGGENFRTFIPDSELADPSGNPESLLLHEEKVQAFLKERNLSLPALCASCDGPEPNCPNCKS